MHKTSNYNLELSEVLGGILGWLLVQVVNEVHLCSIINVHSPVSFFSNCESSHQPSKPLILLFEISNGKPQKIKVM